MEVVILRQFAKDLKKIRTKSLNQSVLQIVEGVEIVDSIQEISNLKKLKGFKNYYRIRVGDYRIGCFIENRTVEFMRIVHRKDIYDVFP